MNTTPIPLTPDDWKTITLGLQVLQHQYEAKGDQIGAFVLRYVKAKVDSHIPKPETTPNHE